MVQQTIKIQPSQLPTPQLLWRLNHLLIGMDNSRLSRANLSKSPASCLGYQVLGGRTMAAMFLNMLISATMTINKQCV